MWGSSEEPPGTMEAGPPETVANLKETCEQSKNQLESVKDIMLRNKQSLKKKEEELQEYAKKLSKFKTRAKTSRPPKDDGMSSSESTPKSKSDVSTTDPSDDVVDDVSQAKTPKAKSSLLQKKLAEDRKIFEQRSKELIESKRAVEEKVEALKQQLEEKYVAPVLPINPVLVSSQAAHPVMELSHIQDKDNKIAELGNKIFELEAIIIDLQENLKEKDSVIDSKTKAITLMSADLSKKGKTTLDTLEDTKDEMRTMQENFVLVETSLRSKNDNLLKQLEEKSSQISVLEDNVQSLTDKLEAQMQAESVSADFSRSTMDTLADTKDAMKSMQENFVLIESSLKTKNEHLLKQLEEREIKLAEAQARILNLETGIGIERQPNVEDLIYKNEKLEETNRNLQDEKYELQKNIASLQDKIILSESKNENSLVNEKDNRIVELENLIEELQKQATGVNEETQNKVVELEKQVHDLENEKMELTTKLSASTEDPKEDEKVQKLTKELDDLNKNMIKLKAQHQKKLKNMQKQLENFKKVSDTNAELVKLGNQVTLLEEEKGNLQLSLVDFDELKASAGDWQERINDLEGKVSAQAKEIQTHIEAIAILENQKLDLMQELHAVKQEVSSLEAENAESENLRVTAEMKVVDLEEELDSLHKLQSEPLTDTERAEFQRQIESLSQDNERLSQKISKLEELKSSSEVGSTESFVKTGSNVDSTESFEALAADADKADLLKKIDGLTRENGALLEKLTRFEEKGSSDTGSTESFERIPEHGESTSRLDNLTRENYELVVKLTKLEEKLAAQQGGASEIETRLQTVLQENERLISELQEKAVTTDEQVREKRSIEEERSVEEAESLTQSIDDASTVVSSSVPIEVKETVDVEELTAKIESLTALNENLTSSLQQLELEKQDLVAKLEGKSTVEPQIVAQELQVEEPIVPEQSAELESSEQAHVVDNSAVVASLESEIERCNSLIAEQKSVVEELRTKLADKEEELDRKSAQISKDSEACDLDIQSLRRELEESASVIAEWKLKCSEMQDKMELLEQGKQQIEEGLRALQAENKNLLEQSEQKDALVSSLKEELDNTISNFEARIKEHGEVISSQEEMVQQLRRSVEYKDEELQANYIQLQNDLIKMDELQGDLAKLKGQIQQRDSTIASLTEEVEALRTNTSVVEEDLFVARHQLTDLHEKLENSKSIEEYNHVMERLNDKEILVEELEGKLSQKLAQVNELKSQAESLSAENEQMRSHIQEEERKIADLLDSNRNQEEALRNAERAKAEVENRLLDLQATHEENLQHAANVTSELQNTYRMLEQLKIKHTEDIEMLNRRLEEVMEEVQAKHQEIVDLQNELDEKNNVIGKSVSQDVKISLESQVSELEKKLQEAEEKAQSQLEKMKKYAAVAKKKTALVDELEAKLNDLEEKWNSEKSEKEARNKELQESASHIEAKDNKIAEMEEELQRLQMERDEALRNVETVNVELNEATDKVNSLSAELKDMSEAKDNARELGVRMEVFEDEYIHQLAEINTLKAENGILLSKQAQINERLENVERESEERRAQLEKYEKEKEIEAMQRSESSQEICTQCATKVQALEAKLQERDAEIENLDNELHNSIGNLVQMQENLRLSTIPSAPDASMQESYNELMLQYNVLTASSEETKTKYEATLRENEELTERISRLQELNATLHERIEAAEKELSKDKEAAVNFDQVHSEYTELLSRFDKQKEELETTRAHLNEASAANEASERDLFARIETLEHEKRNLAQELESLRVNNVVLDDGWGFDATSSSIDMQAQQQPVVETVERQKREVDERAKEDSPPPLFDASVFGISSPPAGNTQQQEIEIERLREELNALRRESEERRIAAEEIEARLNDEIQQARANIAALQESMRSMSVSGQALQEAIKNKEDENEVLQSQVRSANEALASVKAEYERLVTALDDKSERANYLGQLEQLTFEKQEIERVISQVSSSLSIADETASNVQKLLNIEAKLGEILSLLEAVRADNQQLTDTQEIYKNRIMELENELRAGIDSARIAELENRIAGVISERDLLQLQVNDVTRAYEDLKESTIGLRNLQVQLDAAVKERNELVEEIKTLRASKQSELEKPAETVKVEEVTAESMWEDDEDPWGFNDKAIPHNTEQHVNIPIVPSTEIQLQLKVDELEQKLRELTEENAKLIEEGKTAQVKNVKYVKKLKEYKVQFDSLQCQLKSHKSIGGFGADLDSAIEEELKMQIDTLEKNLSAAREETKKVLLEKENLLKRIDVLTAATERFTEAKEKQDTEVHIWQMRYKELEMRLQQLDFGPETKEASSSPPQETIQLNPKYEEELKELKDNVEALAAENEELQQLLEENRVKRQTSVDETTHQVQELQAKNAELRTLNDKLKSDYDSLRKQYEQSLMDANDQVQGMRQNCELLKNEVAEKSAENEKIVTELNEQLHAAQEEKTQLEDKIHTLESDLDKLNSSATSLDELTELLNARVQEVAGLKEELLKVQTDKSHLEENTRATVQQLTDELNEKQVELDNLDAALQLKDGELSMLNAESEEMKGAIEKVNGLELSIEGYTMEVQEKNEELQSLRGRIGALEAALSDKENLLTVQHSQLEESITEIQQCSSQVQDQRELGQKLEATEKRVSELNAIIAEREASLEHSAAEVQRLEQKLKEAQDDKSKLELALQEHSSSMKKEVSSVQKAAKTVDDDLPMFTFPGDSSDNELRALRAELKIKNEEIEHLTYTLNEGSMTRMMQDLQDSVNRLYNEKSDLEDQLAARSQEVSILQQQLEESRSSHHPLRKRSLGDQEELMKLQNELHVRDQEMNELKYIVAEKESQLRAALEQASQDYEQHESSERLRTELYEKHQELESLQFTVSELQSEVASLRGLERLAEEDRATIERLNSEKEEVRREAEETVQRILKEKENELDALKQQIAMENQNLIEALGLRERDIENLKLQIEQAGLDRDGLLEHQTEQLARLEAELSERDRKLTELSITKDTDIHNLQVQLSENRARLEEVIALSEEEERQLVEMRKLLEVKEQQINGLTQQLDEKLKEYELMQHALQRHIAHAERTSQIQHQQQSDLAAAAAPSSAALADELSSTGNELDLALYMLHQRDVRCEELTHELMQLLEERDTLQLRLSNAIRVNEELRKYASAAESSPKKDSSTAEGSSSGDPVPLIQDPSPSKSEGPVEIAREAINSPIGEDKKALAQKLSQLRSVDQGRDVRLRDDRELRHSQQMLLLTHGDVLSKLPPEAAARLVNANYTLSRDVQSQSSVLMNWLWGKSTPKVVHM